jgi:hypothetical protein
VYEVGCLSANRIFKHSIAIFGKRKHWRASQGGVKNISGVEELHIANFRRPNLSKITIIPGLKEMSLPNCRRPSHCNVTITSGVQEISLLDYT